MAVSFTKLLGAACERHGSDDEAATCANVR